jgi:hypothetical protein
MISLKNVLKLGSGSSNHTASDLTHTMMVMIITLETDVDITMVKEDLTHLFRLKITTQSSGKTSTSLVSPILRKESRRLSTMLQKGLTIWTLPYKLILKKQSNCSSIT